MKHKVKDSNAKLQVHTVLTTAYYICILIYCTHTHTYFYLHITAVHRPVDNFEKVVNPMIVLFLLFFQKNSKCLPVDTE